jgi:hypothetical protein
MLPTGKDISFDYIKPRPVDTWLYMMLVSINSELGSVFTIEYLIPKVYAPDGVPVPQMGYRSGIGEQACVPLASCGSVHQWS